MKNYLLTYYNGAAPTFVYTDTIDAARSCATTIAEKYAPKHDHVLSIVNTATDHVIFYATGDSLTSRLSAFGRSVVATERAFSFRSLFSLLTQKEAVTIG